MAGEKNWVFWTSGAHIVSGFEQCATDGFVGVDADGVVYLFDNNQNVLLRPTLQILKELSAAGEALGLPSTIKDTP